MKRNVRGLLATAVVLVALVGCELTGEDGSTLHRETYAMPALEPQPVAPDPTEPGTVEPLPSVVVADVERTEEFAFEAFVSVDIELSVFRFESGETEPLAGDENVVIATVSDPSGNILLRSKVAADGTVNGTVGVRTSADAITVALAGEGFEPRAFTVEDPASKAAIVRSVAIRGLSGRGMMSVSSLPDADGDTVPDVYDAFPGDPTLAFSATYPADGTFTVAYEDLYPRIGDADFNDFVVVYTVTVDTSAGGKVGQISGSATARARAAGYSHEFGLSFNVPGFSGTITSSYEGGTGFTQQFVPTGSEIRVVLFPETKQAFEREGDQVTVDNAYKGQPLSVGYTATFFVRPDANNEALASDAPEPPFDPYLLVKNTGYDVHLINGDPLPGLKTDTEYPGEDFRDKDGNPWGLLVPVDFAHPLEQQNIYEAYPEFGAWVDSGGKQFTDWYLGPVEELVFVWPATE